jgi:hypothetical protein
LLAKEGPCAEGFNTAIAYPMMQTLHTGTYEPYSDLISMTSTPL